MGRKYFFNRKKSFDLVDKEILPEVIDFIGDSLKEAGIDRRLILRTELLAEELIDQFIEKADREGSLRVQVKRFTGDATVHIHAPGDSFDPFVSVAGEDISKADDEEAQSVIRSILLKSQGDKLKVTHKNGVNRARILVGQEHKSLLIRTVTALVLGLIFGAVMRLALPEALSGGIDTYLLSPFKTMFMNALKIVIAPVVFFSMVASVSQFNNISELGKIGLKVMGVYMMTTLIAVVLALSIGSVIRPGSFGFALSEDVSVEEVSVDTEVDTSLINTIVNIVPSNFVRPFVEADTLQIMFLAVLCGLAVGMIGDYSSVLKDFFDACNALFLTITGMITKFIPIGVFCSVAQMIRNMGGGSFMTVIGALASLILGLFLMIAIYGLLILVLARLNPFTFYKKNREGMLTSFTLSSSSAAMPVNMKTCTDKLGISPRVSNFSIPLGATVNMDGTCMMLGVITLFLARAYGVVIPGAAMVSLAVTIILLSLGAPGVPGSGIVCLGVSLASVGIPIEAIGMVIGVYPFMDMFDTMSNTTGDVAVSVVVAKSEGMIDVDVYNSQR